MTSLALVALALVVALVLVVRRSSRAFAPLSRRAPRRPSHVLATLRDEVSDALLPLASLLGMSVALVLLVLAR